MTSTGYGPEIEQIQEQCETHERFLKELVRGTYAYVRSYLPGELSFGIARRWNSWYPSYFDVEGGCYVLIPGDLDPHNPDNEKDTRIGVVVVDPGFKFMDVLRADYQIEPRDVSTVVVTHFHPDHMSGLLEYTTIMNTTKQPCNVYLNETTYATFKSLQNAYITVNELLDGQIQEVMRYVTRDSKYVRVTVKAVGVHHNEIGNQHRSLGLILETTMAESEAFEPNSSTRYRIGILGDTDGSSEYVPFYVHDFHEVDILILHLGTFSNKKLGRGGKHLYIEGVRRVLRQMRSKLEETRGSGKIVVLSEFGLELADENSLYHKLQPFIESHSWRLPLIFTGLYLQRQSDGEDLSDDKEGSRFFARATLEILERACKSSPNSISAHQEALTRKEVDELLVALAFQVLAFSSPGLREMVKELQDELADLIGKEKGKRLIDTLPLEKYIRLLDGKELENEIALDPLRKFYQVLVQESCFAQVPLPKDRLIKSCELLIERISRNLEDFTSALWYMDKLSYISKYAESRGIREYRWAYGTGTSIKDLSLFWSTCLTGVFVLRETLEVASFEHQPAKENPLLQIAAFFQKDAVPWANLLVGDIGCTFGIDPFTAPDDRRRAKGIRIKSADGDWISPHDAECFYDNRSMRISYRAPQANTPDEK